jgi:hypothetical protein
MQHHEKKGLPHKGCRGVNIDDFRRWTRQNRQLKNTGSPDGMNRPRESLFLVELAEAWAVLLMLLAGSLVASRMLDRFGALQQTDYDLICFQQHSIMLAT